MMPQSNNNVYRLTATQQAMLIYSLYAPRSRAYFEQACYSYRGALDLEALAQAWQLVVDRHAILRTSFSSDDSEHLFQTVQSQVALPYQQHDWRGLVETDQQDQLDEFLEKDASIGFDLAKCPLLRVAVLQTADDAYWIVISNHHIVIDGWSMSVLRKEVSQIYRTLAHDEQFTLEPPVQFGEFLKWQDAFLKQNERESHKFWHSEFEGFSGPNCLPIGKAAGRFPGPSEEFSEKQLTISPALTNAIKAGARKHHLTMSTLFQAAWGLLLSRYCDTDDVVFGITVSGRPYELPGIESMVGLLINTLPVRMRIDQNASCLSHLKKVQSSVAGLLEHEQSSLSEIQQCCELPRQVPLFETLLIFENYAGSGSSFYLDGPSELFRTHYSRTNYPLTLIVDPGEELRLQLVYHSSRFTAGAVERMLAHLGNILESMVADIEQPVRSLQLLSDSENQTLTVDWNRTSTVVPKETAIHRLFEQQAKLTPEAVALVHEDRRLTYAELNARANRLAHHLKELGVGPDTLIGICVERSVEMIVAVLSTLKAGAAYVPLDPTYPEARLAFMLSDSGINILLTQERLLQELPHLGGLAKSCVAVVKLDRDEELIRARSAEDLRNTISAGDLAYVIYTSGSTGNPKGTMIEHRSLINFALAAREQYAISPADRVLQFASLSFDTSAEEIFPALVAGATLILRTDPMLSSAEDFLRSCGDLGVTVLDLPTAYWHELTDEICADNLRVPGSLRLIIVGGEKALPDRVATWLARVGDSARLLNTYGPTETTIVATVCDLSSEIGQTLPTEVPIGRPISNVKLYVLDRLLRPVPVGIPGELYIGGAGVARGYLNRPDLTAQKFISNPLENEGTSLLYKTGDVVRYRVDGNLEFVGRVDNQVKIRGFRVELEEIERAITNHENVSDAVVVVQGETGADKRLIAYVVSGRAAGPSVGELRQFLISRLPTYMLPAAFVMIDALPLMANGKIDRKALPNLPEERPALDGGFEAPRSPLEESVAQVWQELLHLDRVGINDNFFELGGHSLMAAKLISKLRRNLDIQLKLIDIFQSPTVARLAELIYERTTEGAEEEDLVTLLAELENLSDEEAQQKLAYEVSKGGALAHALKLAIATGSYAALEILSSTV